MTATSVARSIGPVPALWDPDVFVGGAPARIPRRAAPHPARLLAGHARRARLLGRAHPRRPRRGRPRAGAVLGQRGWGRAREPAARPASSRCAGCCWRWTRPSTSTTAGRWPRASRPESSAASKGRIRAICRRSTPRPREAGDVEFVHDVATLLPIQIVGELMGLPKEDWPQIQRWAEMNTSGQDPDIVDPERGHRRRLAYETSGVGTMHMAIYAMQFAAQRRTEEPREDLTSLILASDFSGGPMSDARLRHLLRAVGHRGQRHHQDDAVVGRCRRCSSIPSSSTRCAPIRRSSPGAVEEILRYENPLHYFRRTATADAMLRGVDIKAGDKVAMYYSSANRDEDVFDEPHRFDIRRRPNPHLSFGIGEHFCLGVHLARLEGRVFFEEVLSTFSTIEMTATRCVCARTSMPARATQAATQADGAPTASPLKMSAPEGSGRRQQLAGGVPPCAGAGAPARRGLACRATGEAHALRRYERDGRHRAAPRRARSGRWVGSGHHPGPGPSAHSG